MICFAFFHWHQKSLGVQGGHSGLYLAFNGSLKRGPGDGWACVGAHTHTHTHIWTEKLFRMSETKPRPCFCLSLFYFFFLPNHSPTLSGQIAAAFDVLRSTFAGASALFYDSNSFCFYGHLFQHSVQSFYWHFKAHPPAPIFQALFPYGSYKNF